MRYRLFDFAIESDIIFDQLPSSRLPASIELRQDPEPWHSRRAAWFHEFARRGEARWLRVGRVDRQLILDFCGSAVIRYVDGVALWQRHSRAGDAALRHTLLDQGLPLIAAHEGRTVLHAACVTTEGGAILLAGATGAGKSTLAAALANHLGAVVGDDATALSVHAGTIVACPAYAAVRLWPDSSAALRYDGGIPAWEGSRKRAFRTGTVPGEPVALRSIYVLEAPSDGPDTRVAEMSRREVLMALVRHAYVLDPEDRARAAAHFDDLSAIAQDAHVRRLFLPHRFDAVPHAVSLLERDRRECGVTR